MNFAIVYFPVAAYFMLEFIRRSPVKEERHNRGSGIFVGIALTWMIIIPTVVKFVTGTPVKPGLLALGIAAGSAGIWIRLSAMRELGRFYSRNIGIQERHKLIRTGWYRWIRHPGYLGTLLTFFGFALSTSLWICVVTNLILFFAAYSYRIRVEERAMLQLFGSEYTEYSKQTWRLIPYIY